MNYKILAIVTALCFMAPGKYLLAENQNNKGDESHKEKSDPAKEENHEEEKDHKHAEGEKKDHGGDEEEAKNVGPEKGVTSFDEEAGFKISQEATKTFSIEKLSLNGSGPWTVPVSAILFTSEDKSVYRVRKDFFKRVDVQILRKDKNSAVIQSSDLASGDTLVTKGASSLRVAELDVTSGESGHSH